MRIGVAATPHVAIPTLDWLDGSLHELVLVITQPDRPAGRGRALRDSPVAQWAHAHSIACVKPISSIDLVDSLMYVDLVITIGYGVILPSEVLTIPRYGFINLHFSHLPAWRGAAPVQRAILHGDQKFGLTVFALDSGMDTGPIYVQRDIDIEPYENAGQLLSRMAILGPELISETLDLIESGAVPYSQIATEDIEISYAPKISKDDARIIWEKSAIEVDRQIRAFTPEPGAWTSWRSSTLRITRARPYISISDLVPGQISIENGNLLVGCGDGDSNGDENVKSALVIEELTPAGKNSMSAKNWINGARCMPGECFG